MKQVLTTIASFVLRSPLHHSISSQKAFAKYSFLLLLAATVLLLSSCKKELRDYNSPSSDLLSSFQKQNKDKNKPLATIPTALKKFLYY